MNLQPVAVDLFAGAGGLSLGLAWAGFEVHSAIEIDKYAARTYKRNHKQTNVLETDITELSDSWIRQQFQGIDLLAGGPPCQGFSVAGPSQYGKIDDRNSLLMHFLRFVSAATPQWVLLENVRGILSGKITKKKTALSAYTEQLAALSYQTKVYVVQAATFGVPQNRSRVIVLASRNGVFPQSLNGPFSISDWVTCDQALSDLPAILSGQSYEPGGAYRKAAKGWYARMMRAGSDGVHNHEAMFHSERILERLRLLQPGNSMKDVAHLVGQRDRSTGVIKQQNVYKMNYTKLALSSVSLSLPANFQTIHVHPELPRMLTAREGARIQSFPDSYLFEGPRTLMSRKLLTREGREDEIGLSQFNQIGNAVPPLMAAGLGSALLNIPFHDTLSKLRKRIVA